VKPKIVRFACPAELLERIDEIAREEMLSRADVCRRALKWEATAAGTDTTAPVNDPVCS
jgi:metal-responsive CopG/Arc/MetJ family transcriptional regulator